MSDFSNLYSVNKNSEIIIAKNNVIIRFKPFIESYSMEVKNNSLKIEAVDTITHLDESYKERRYKLSFNVPSLSQSDGKLNHQKFQKLLRMCMPDGVARENSFYIKFANLIKKPIQSSEIAVDPSTKKILYDYNNFIKNLGVHCKVSNLNYSPEMDLGFFDEDGMFFAKNFKIDLDLEIIQDSFPAIKKYKKDFIKKGKDLINPGSLFGFEVKYNKENEEEE